MDLARLLEDLHEEIVRRWVGTVLSDRSSRYASEGEQVLLPLMNRSARAFRLALCNDDWAEHDAFINMIARKRLAEGFKLSEVQGVFQLYARTLIPLLIPRVEPERLAPVLLDLNRCMAHTVGRFSEYFQDLHDRFIRDQAVFLEREVAHRTKELAESEQKYKSLIEDLRDGYFAVVKGTVAFANGAFCEMHGCTVEEVLGRAYLDFVAPESRAEMRQTYEQLGSGPQPRLEYLRLERDGRRTPTELVAKLSTYAGSPAKLGVCRDLSAQIELERKKREAEKLNAVAQVAASLAHDIRNPLTAIKMNVQMLAEGAAASATYQRLLETSLREVESIERSVTEMMDLARPFRLDRQTVALGPFLSRCVDILAHRIRAKRVTATLRAGRDLPELRLDAHRMEQALLNLLFNALEALPEGGRIWVATRAVQDGEGRWGEIRVSDDGPGIPGELLPYVFDSQKCRGIGLGLDNVRKIVEAHGGAVLVKPRRPRGVSFLLRLPMED